jgi:hypothetical protein
VVAAWRATVERPYNWAARGRSSQAAVWKCALESEAAEGRGQLTAALLVDLTKAFEMVRLELVWLHGLRLQLHPCLVDRQEK